MSAITVTPRTVRHIAIATGRPYEQFRADPACFLYLPLRVVITEASDGSAVLGLDAPADLFDVFQRPELTEVGAEFTGTLGQLLRHLGLPVPREITGTDGGE